MCPIEGDVAMHAYDPALVPVMTINFSDCTDLNFGRE
jgi:hypothetical protein